MVARALGRSRGHRRGPGGFGWRYRQPAVPAAQAAGGAGAAGRAGFPRRRGRGRARHHDGVGQERAPARPRPAEELAPASEQVTEPAAPQARVLLDQYIAAFENADVAALERLLVRDATLEATPMRTWFAGRKTCVPFLRDRVLGSPGFWRMLATGANGQPAAAAYTRDQEGGYQPYGVVVFTVTGAGIHRVSCFGDPGLVALFGFPVPSPG